METALAWSGGKDAAYALHACRSGTASDAGEPVDCDIVELLTTVSAETDRTTMHGLRPELVRRQAESVGLPLTVVELPPEPSNEEYEERMARAHRELAERGIEAVAFADLHLADVREYREEQLADAPLAGVWPLWGRDTTDLSRTFLDAGFRAVVVAVDGRELDPSFAGRDYDDAFLADLPDDVDPCGEGGEFHTFVRDGPVFDVEIAVERGERVTRQAGGADFHYCDLVPV